MNHLGANLSHLMAQNAWLIKIGLTLFFGFLFSWLMTFFYHRLQPRLAKTSKNWDEALIISAYKPLQMLVWFIVFSVLLPVLVIKLGLDGSVTKYFTPARQIFLVITIFWFGMRFISNTEMKMISQPIKASKKSRDITTVRAISQLFRVTLIILTVLIAIQSFGGNISTLLTLGGVGGIAVGFAAKDTLANFLGGMMIFWDRPFSVGDWVRSPDRAIEGTVEHIGWRLTRIRTFDKRPLYVPNGAFSTISLENPSRMLNRRIKTTVGLRYQDAPKLSQILGDIEAMLRNHSEIDTNQTLMVNLFEFGASSLNVLIYTFTKTTNWVKFQAVQQDVFLKIIEIITQHNAECAFPTTTLDIPPDTLINSNQHREQ
jgi:MscS family membrane protein